MVWSARDPFGSRGRLPVLLRIWADEANLTNLRRRMNVTRKLHFGSYWVCFLIKLYLGVRPSYAHP